MSKLYLLVTLLLVNCIFASAQTRAVYFNSDGKIVGGTTNYRYKMLIGKVDGDALWHGVTYNKAGLLLTRGTYRDSLGQIPHGKFIYYDSYVEKGAGPKEFTQNTFIKILGGYIDGERAGPWLEYFRDGRKNKVVNYMNGKQNGLYQTYARNGTVLIEGYYLDDVRIGDWCVLNNDSLVVSSETYDKGKIVKTVSYENNLLPFIGVASKIHKVNSVYLDKDGKEIRRETSIESNDEITVDASANFDLDDYLKKALFSNSTEDANGLAVVQFWVDEDGKLNKVSMIRKIDSKTDKAIIDAFTESPAWKPAKKKKKTVEQVLYCAVSIQHSKITTNCQNTLLDLFSHP